MGEPTNPKKLEILLSEVLDNDGQQPDPEVYHQLSELLESSPSARTEYLHIVSMHGMLQDLQEELQSSDDELVTAVAPPSTCDQTPAFSSPWVMTRALPILTLLFVIVIFFVKFRIHELGKVVDTGNQPIRRQKADLFVARITQANAAIWKQGEQLSIGRVLNTRLLELTAGDAEITFDSGATITMSAPCKLTVDSANSATLHSGRVWANVPDLAIGFVIETPNAKVEDLGTKFSVQVAADGESNVAVLEGEVRVEAIDATSDKKQSIVRQNQVVQIDGHTHQFSNLAFSADWAKEKFLPAFTDGIDVPYYHWSFNDETTPAFFSEDGRHNQLHRSFDATLDTEQGMGSPALTTIQGVSGEAVQFNGEGAYLRTELKGISGDDPRTICCWIRIPKDAQSENAYSFIAWGSEKLGRKWQLSWNAHMYVAPGIMGALRTEIGSGYVIGTQDLRDGEWHHVASVFLGNNEKYDSSDMRNRVRLYVDGKLEPVSAFLNREIDTEVNQDSFPVSFGRYIGVRPSDDSPRFQSFKGAIDEMYLFEGALTPNQIMQLMQKGTPPRRGEIIPVLHGT